MNEAERQEVEQKVKLIKIREKSKHIFLCMGPKCCAKEEAEKVWDHLKERLKDGKFAHVNRTRADCLRICRQGPVALVYPEGIWYAQVNKDVCDRILDEHILGGRPVAENIIAEKKLD